MMDFGRILLVLVPLVPLAGALTTFWIRRPVRLLPWFALPGLLAAFLAPQGAMVRLPGALLGVGLKLDLLGAVFLGFAAFLWMCAGAYASASMAGKERESGFCLFWNLTLAGTLGVFVAADAATFYVCFALLSLAAYGLVVHDSTEPARRAGLIYIVLAVFGEICLLLGILMGSEAAHSILIEDIRRALADAPLRDYAFIAIIIGFGLKAGLIPLHVWLPLAHSAAPVPASAVLSGAIVKAGLIGLVRFLPLDEAPPGWAGALTAIGLASAYYGILVGLVQHQAKAVLAYSTMSQMGLLVAVLGSGLAASAAAVTASATALYATHHGLAKGALFLAVGVVAASGGRAARLAWGTAAILGAAIAGLPLTGGALAKLAIKDPLGEGQAALLATLSAVGTMLLMVRFLVLVKRQSGGQQVARPPAALVVPFALTAAAALFVPWLLFPHLVGHSLADAVAPAALWAALWPILLAGAIALAFRKRQMKAPRIPVGDIAALGETALAWVGATYRNHAAQWTLLFSGRPLLWRLHGDAHDWVSRSPNWSAIGTAIVIITTILGLALV